MQWFIDDLEKRTEKNTDFRRVIFTAPHMQLVLMSLEPGEEIGEETHTDTDQFFWIEEGTGEMVLDGRVAAVEATSGILVPEGTRHNVRNTGHEPMRLYTIYAPPHHPDGTVHKTRAEAEAAEQAAH